LIVEHCDALKFNGCDSTFSFITTWIFRWFATIATRAMLFLNELKDSSTWAGSNATTNAFELPCNYGSWLAGDIAVVNIFCVRCIRNADAAASDHQITESNHVDGCCWCGLNVEDSITHIRIVNRLVFPLDYRECRASTEYFQVFENIKIVSATQGTSPPLASTKVSSTPSSVSMIGEAGSLIAVRSIISAPADALASMMAARKVQTLSSVRHIPSPGEISTLSIVLSTTKVSALADVDINSAANVHDTSCNSLLFIVFSSTLSQPTQGKWRNQRILFPVALTIAGYCFEMIS
jgi:hypothetical protein